jgi:PAS domain S-box-containing protein
VILGLGCGISFLLFFLVLILSRQRDVAMRLAEAMTYEIRDKNETLRLSQERFELAVQGTNDGIWDWNIVTDEVYYSPRMYELLGVSAGQLGTSLEAFMAYVHPDDQERLQTHVQRHLEDDGNFDLNYRVKVRRDDQDEWRWFNARGMAIRDEKGKPIRMSGALTDITERHKAEQLKTEFVSTVSHELRTPLTSIGGTLSLIRGGVLGEVPVKMQAMLETAHKNSLRLGRLIDDLLDMEKLAAGKMQMNFCTLELMPLIEQALDANHSYAQRFQVSLRVSQRVDSAYVEVDPERLQQILSNLLSNAAKYSPTGDSVDISVARIDGNLRVSIWDHGAGIPPEFHARIFQKFSQADSSDTREKGGTGLGLAITKELVDRMHGQIGFTSKSGEGTCFYIDLQEVDATS